MHSQAWGSYVRMKADTGGADAKLPRDRQQSTELGEPRNQQW